MRHDQFGNVVLEPGDASTSEGRLLRQLLIHVWQDANHLFPLPLANADKGEVVETLKAMSDADVAAIAGEIGESLDAQPWSTDMSGPAARIRYDCWVLNSKLRSMVGTIIPEVFEEVPAYEPAEPAAPVFEKKVPGWGEW